MSYCNDTHNVILFSDGNNFLTAFFVLIVIKHIAGYFYVCIYGKFHTELTFNTSYGGNNGRAR